MERFATLGDRVRALRKRLALTLVEVSARSGISTANLSKIENGRVSPSYDVLEKLARGLEITLSDLVSADPGALEDAPGARYAPNQGALPEVLVTPQYDYAYLSAELLSKRMVPIIMRPRARTLDDFGPLLRHGGEEFIYVLRGTIEVHTEHYAPRLLKTGESLYLDSTMGHAFLWRGKAVAEILTVATEPVPRGKKRPGPAGPGPRLRER